MREPLSPRRLFLRLTAWAALLTLAGGLFFAYLWAERQRERPEPRYPITRASGVTVRLNNAPFQGYTGGRLAWTLQADQIDLQRVQGGSLTNVANATLTGIRDGALYEVPADLAPALGDQKREDRRQKSEDRSQKAKAPNAQRPTPNAEMPLFVRTRPKTPPAATFRARQGYYTLGATETLPPQIANVYNLQWQFKLVGDVDFRTRSGDRLRADTLTILELLHRHTWRVERRILCESGVRVTSKDVETFANRAQYYPNDRTVECNGGVRSTFRQNTVQTDKLFWFMGEQTIRCPEPASGTLRGMPFTAEGLVIDLKRRTLHANSAEFEIRMDNAVEFDLP